MNFRASAAAALFFFLAAGHASAAEVRAFVRGSWGDIRAAHAARPTIVHIWGPSCGPCLAELPDWGKFIAVHKDADLVLVNADGEHARRGATKTRLNNAGLRGVESWEFAESHIDRLRFEIDPNWQGELPYTVLISPGGAVTSFSGSADFAALAKWVDGQLGR